jgi:hypothetical protein
MSAQGAIEPAIPSIEEVPLCRQGRGIGGASSEFDLRGCPDFVSPPRSQVLDSETSPVSTVVTHLVGAECP